MSHCPFNEYLPQIGDVHSIVEVGCHRMQDTQWMRALWPAARLICFDPDPRTEDYLRRHYLPEELRAEFYPYAVGSAPGAGQLYLCTNFAGGDAEWTQASSLRRPRGFGTRKNLEQSPGVIEDIPPISVRIVALDSFLPDLLITAPDLIWMDAQAYEDEIIAGARAILAKTRYLFTEYTTCGVYEHELNLEKMLALLPGWEVLKVLPTDVFLKNKALP